MNEKEKYLLSLWDEAWEELEKKLYELDLIDENNDRE